MEERMDAVLEKITLYDILGYLLPGSVLVLLVSYGEGQAGVSIDLGWWSGSEGFEFFVFFLISYLVGIVLSQVMTWIWRVGEWFPNILPEKFRRCVCTFVGNITVFFTGKGKQEENEKNADIWHEETEEALIKSGIKDSSDKFQASKKQKTLERDYMQYMYGFIQGIDKYKRIHNYASAYVLYKNIAGALLIGSFYIWFFCGVDDLWFLIVCFTIGLIFVFRGIRFQMKKNDYTVIWFLEEFNSQKDFEQRESSQEITT